MLEARTLIEPKIFEVTGNKTTRVYTVNIVKVAQGDGAVALVDNLTSTSTTSALTANQGRLLNQKVDTKLNKDQVLTPVPENALFTDTVYDDTSIISAIGNIDAALDTINGQII